MPPRIIPILDRLRQDIAAALSKETIEEACRQVQPLLAEAHPRPRHHHLPLPAPGPPRQHRLPARRPLRRLDLHRQRLLPGPQAAPPGRLPLAPREDRRRVPIRHRRRFALARPSRLARRRLELLHARRPRAAAPLRPARQPAARAAASPWPSGWRCSTSPPACCSARRRRRCGPTRCRRAAAISRELEPGDLVLGDRGFCSYAHLALLSAAGCTGCSASTRSRSSTSRPAVPGRAARLEGSCPACPARGGCWRRASPIRWSSGSSRKGSRRG